MLWLILAAAVLLIWRTEFLHAESARRSDALAALVRASDARFKDFDRRLSRRLYELTGLLEHLEEQLWEIQWDTVRLQAPDRRMVPELRQQVQEEQQNRTRWVKNRAAVLPENEGWPDSSDDEDDWEGDADDE